MWGFRLISRVALGLLLVAGCGNTGGRSSAVVQPCKVDADCPQGRCLETGFCSVPTSPTTNYFVSFLQQGGVDKADLLFVIDNSISMADKQAIFRDAVPQLVNRLITPQVDPAMGSPEFKPVVDLHIGIVSSSLGGHGADFCSPTGDPNWNPTKDDHGRLIGAPGMRAGAPPTFQNLGFLAWDPTNKYGGEASAAALISNFQALVTVDGETGCGFEATLEAWYRFLIDPNPPVDIVTQNGTSVPLGTDNDVLAQRAAFLRPDSLVGIIMLTDENDCSVMDSGAGWLSSQGTLNNVPFHLPRATSVCNTTPNDPCCVSCNATNPPAGCNLAGDPECAKGGSLDEVGDSLNLRCWQQKRRFGIDFLYPTDRYVNALKSNQVTDRDGQVQANPLYLSGGSAPRDPGRVFLAGIVGVPWQDIATPESLTGPDLVYLRSDQINWDWIVGDVNNWVMPQDPLMIEGPDPRTGVNPVTNDPLAPPTSTNPQENAMNGHEYNIPLRNDLQYACIFQLGQPRDCSTGTGACDCLSFDVSMNKPLCQPPGGGQAGTTQYFAKAYPGLRLLQVLQDFGENSIVGSVCPKLPSGDATNPSSGYKPAVDAIVDRFREVMGAQCLPRELQTLQDDPATPQDETGKVPCDVVEALSPGAFAGCDAALGRTEIATDDALRTAVLDRLASAGSCGGASGIPCTSFGLCRLAQLVTPECQTSPTPTTPGFCYINDPNNALLADCPDFEKRILRFVGDNVPAKGAIVMLACTAQSLGSGAGG
jgi:hypothetical protein